MTKVGIDAQGHLLKVTVYRDGPAHFRVGRRGDITKFSHNSRMRLLRKLARMEIDPLKGYRSQASFLTLTTKAVLHPRLAKAALFNFLKSIRGRFPSVSAVWRMEYQERGAPHFHLIMFNTPWLDKEWIGEEWGRAVFEERPFTRIRRVYSHRGMMAYVSKYVGKVAPGVTGFNNGSYLTTLGNLSCDIEDSPGRVWGVFNRDGLPLARALGCDLDVGDSWHMIRSYCRFYYRWISDYSDQGFTVFCDNPYHALAHIRKIYNLFG